VVTDPSARRSLRVIVADDEPFTVSLVSEGLRGKGFEIHTAASVDRAWNLIEKHQPHAVICDLDFGSGSSGARLLMQVRERYPWVGLVILTSHQHPQLAVHDATALPPDCVYLVKSDVRELQVLVDAVGRSISGEPHARPLALPNAPTLLLTPAQAQVLRMLANGSSTRAVARERGTTVRAVEAMLARMYAALGIANDEHTNAQVEAVSLWQQGQIRIR
jgi:DNA-binding NarL/FixJ family response regulator